MNCVSRFGGFFVAAGVLWLGCSDERRGPTTPSGILLLEQATTWACGRIANETGRSYGGWVFHEAVPTCVTQPWLSETAGDGVITVAPGNLRSIVTGTTVRLEWDAVAGATAFLVEAGSAPTLANLAAFNTGNPATTLVVQSVPAGTFYLRVRGVGPDGIAGPASNEIILRVGTSCASAPGAPTGFAAQVAGNQLTLSWAAGAGDAPASYVLEAGSAPGSSNLVVYDTGTATPGLAGTAPNGTYYVRVRGRNACGTGPASNEFIVGIPNGSGPPQPPGQCTYTVTPSSVSLSALDGEFDVNVDTPAGCAWTVTSNTPFVTLRSSGSTSGRGAARFSVPANSGGAARTGNVRIAWTGGSREVAVSQIAPPPAPPRPTPRVEDVIRVIPNPPGTPPVVENVTPVPTPPPPPRPNPSPAPTVRVSPGPAPRTIATDVSAATPFNIVYVATDEGSGAAVDGAAGDVSSSHYVIRLASLQVSVNLAFALEGDRPFVAQFAVSVNSELPGSYGRASVTTTPAPCTYSVTPTSSTPVSADGGTFEVSVTTTAGCAWTAASNASFITVGAGSGGAGTGIARFIVAPNTGEVRSGQVRIAWTGGGQDIPVPQAGRTVANRNPIISGITTSPTGVALLAVTNVSFTAASSDPDSDPLVFDWTFGSGESGAVTGAGATAQHLYSTRTGAFTVTVTARDNRGGTATMSRTIDVVDVTATWVGCGSVPDLVINGVPTHSTYIVSQNGSGGTVRQVIGGSPATFTVSLFLSHPRGVGWNGPGNLTLDDTGRTLSSATVAGRQYCRQ